MVEQPDGPRNLPWFRLYTEFATDPAIQILAFEDQRHYIILLCLKGSGVLDKSYPSAAVREAVLARSLGLSLAAADEALRRLCEAGVADLHGQPLAWERRQPVRDRSVERTRKWRQRKAGDGGDGAVTVGDKADVDVDVEESKSKAGPDRGGVGGYVDNSVDNSAPAGPALSQATVESKAPPTTIDGKAPSLAYSDAIARAGALPGRLPQPMLAGIARATAHVCRSAPGTAPEAVYRTVRQIVDAHRKGATVDVWAYILRVLPEKAAQLVEERLEAEAAGRRDEFARERAAKP